MNKRRLIKALRMWAERLEQQADESRHRLEIDNARKAQLYDYARTMRDAADLLEDSR